MSHLHRLLYRLGNRLDGLLVSYLLGRIHVAHHHTEYCERNPQQRQTGKHDTHRHERHTETVWVFALELVNLRFADGRNV